MGDRIQSFRTRLKDQLPLIGTFVKTPSPVICELLSHARLDVVCLDAEHAPFGRIEIDGCIAALRAADQPSLVRVSADTPADIRNALDAGATGILVPHVKSVEQAAAIVHASRYGEGGRGYSGSAGGGLWGQGNAGAPARQRLPDNRHRPDRRPGRAGTCGRHCRGRWGGLCFHRSR